MVAQEEQASSEGKEMTGQRGFTALNDLTWRQSPTSAKEVGYMEMIYTIRKFIQNTQPPNLLHQTSLILIISALPLSSTIHPLLFINRMGRLGRLGKYIEKGILHHTQPRPTYPASGHAPEIG